VTGHLLSIPNGGAAPLDQLPRLGLEAFRDAVIGARGRGRRVSALFGALSARGFALYLVLADDDTGLLECACAELDADRFPSMTPECVQVHLFEREIAEQWGVIPAGHPWLKPVRFHSSYVPGAMPGAARPAPPRSSG
jgi:Ni,Fe-hydrogenase III component G